MKKKINEGGGAAVEFVFNPNSRTGGNLRTKADLTGEGTQIKVDTLPLASYDDVQIAQDGGYITFNLEKVKVEAVRMYNEYDRKLDEEEISVDDIDSVNEINPKSIPNLIYSWGWVRGELPEDTTLTWSNNNQTNYLPEIEVVMTLTNGEIINTTINIDGEYHISEDVFYAYQDLDNYEDDYDENYKGKKVMTKKINEEKYHAEQMGDGKWVIKDEAGYIMTSDKFDTKEEAEADIAAHPTKKQRYPVTNAGVIREAKNDAVKQAIDLYKKQGLLMLDDEDDKKAYDTLHNAGYTMKKNMAGDVAYVIELERMHEAKINEISDETVENTTNARKRKVKNAERAFTKRRNQVWKETEDMPANDRKKAIANDKKLAKADARLDRANAKLRNNVALANKRKTTQTESLAQSILREANSVLTMNESEASEMTTWQFTARGFSKAMMGKQPVFGSTNIRCIIHENTDGKIVGTAVVDYYMSEAQVEEAIKQALAENGFKASNVTDLVNLY